MIVPPSCLLKHPFPDFYECNHTRLYHLYNQIVSNNFFMDSAGIVLWGNYTCLDNQFKNCGALSDLDEKISPIEPDGANGVFSGNYVSKSKYSVFDIKPTSSFCGLFTSNIFENNPILFEDITVLINGLTFSDNYVYSVLSNSGIIKSTGSANIFKLTAVPFRNRRA